MRRALIPILLSLGCSSPMPHGAIDAPAGAADAPQTIDDAPADAPIDARRIPPIDARVVVDAYLACQPPSTAPPMITISGQIISGTTVDVLPRDGTTVLGTYTSDVGDYYSITVPTGGVPIDVRLHASNSPPAVEDTWVYPSGPLAQDTTIHVEMYGRSQLGNCNGTTAEWPQTLVVADVQDCLGNNLVGAMVTSTPTQADTAICGSPTGTDGRARVYNSPPGETTVSATTSDGTALAPITVTTLAGTVTQVLIH